MDDFEQQLNAYFERVKASGEWIEVEPTQAQIDRCISLGGDPAQMQSWAPRDSGRTPKQR